MIVDSKATMGVPCFNASETSGDILIHPRFWPQEPEPAYNSPQIKQAILNLKPCFELHSNSGGTLEAESAAEVKCRLRIANLESAINHQQYFDFAKK